MAIPREHINAVRNTVNATINVPGPNLNIDPPHSAREIRHVLRDATKRDEAFKAVAASGELNPLHEHVKVRIRATESHYEDDVIEALATIREWTNEVHVLEITCLISPRGEAYSRDYPIVFFAGDCAIERLSHAIGNCINLTTIIFRNCEVSNVALLCAALNRRVNLTSIRFYSVNFQAAGFFENLTAKSHLRTFAFIDSCYNGCMVAFGQFVKRCPVLIGLNMSGNNLTAINMYPFAEGFAGTMPIEHGLQHINLSNNQIGAYGIHGVQGLHRLLNVFRCCTRLISVNLTNNAITDHAVRLLVTALIVPAMPMFTTIMLNENGLSNNVVSGVIAVGENRALNTCPAGEIIPIDTIASWGNPTPIDDF